MFVLFKGPHTCGYFISRDALVHKVVYNSSWCSRVSRFLDWSYILVLVLTIFNEEDYLTFKVILYSYLILKKMNERITDS